MLLTARRPADWRARSRAGVALVVLASWFGALLVAAPTVANAAGTPGPAITAAPASPRNDPSPTWSFDLGPTTSTTSSSVDPVTSDTTTVTIATTHRAECAVDTAAPSSYATCGTSTPTSGVLSFTPPALTAPGDYRFYVRDVQTTTTTTAVDYANGNPSTSSDDGGVTSTTDASVSGVYVFDTVPPTVSLQSAPPATGPTTAVGWVFKANETAAVSCVLTDGTTPVTGACGPADPVFPGHALVDGSYTVTATATDTAGNTGPSTVVTYDLDTTGPTLTLAGGPATATSNNGSPAWKVTSEGGLPVTCSLTRNGVAQPSLTGRCELGGYPAAALPADGTWVLGATGSDAAGNSSTAPSLATYVLDTRAPVLTIGPLDATAPARPSWSISADEAGVVKTCRLTGTIAGTGAAYDSGASVCGSAFAPAADLAEGSYTLTVTGTDVAGNAAVPVPTGYTYDVTAPGAPVLTGASGLLRTPSFSWTVAAADSDTSRIDCVVKAPDASTTAYPSCTGTLPITPTQQGTWSLTATAFDAAGNASGAAGPRTVNYDSVINPTQVVRNGGTAKAPTWHVTVDPDATATCSVAGVLAATACTNADVTVNLAGKQGAVYTLVVTAVDVAGNAAPTVSVDYVLPPDPPAVSVAGQGSSTTPPWTVTAQANATLTCTLVSPSNVRTPVTPCQNGTVTTTLGADGVWNLEVVATIPTGASTTVDSPVGTTPAGYRLDTAAPGDPSIASSPAGPQNTSTVHWSVTAAPGDTTNVICEVYFTPVATGVTGLNRTIPGCQTSGVDLALTSAQEGRWQAKATAYDAVGNSSNVVVGPLVTYDATPPVMPDILPLPSPSNDASPTWTITHEVGSNLSCAWSTGSAVPAPGDWFACNSPAVIGVPLPAADGTYVLHARATDAATNTGPEDTQAYQLDRTAPAAPTFSTPASPSSSASVSWTLGSGAEVSPTLECQLLQDDGTGTFGVAPGFGWKPCTSATTFSVATLPAENGYRLQSRVTDQAGNLGPVGTSAVYLYDKTPPAVPTVAGPTGPSKTRDVTWTITKSAAADTLECRNVENGTVVTAFAACGTTVTRTSLPDGRYALQVQELDAAGNRSAPVSVSPTYVIDNAGPAAPTFSGTAGTGHITSASWSFQGELGATARCTLLHNGVALSATPATCLSGDAFALGAGDGSYQVEVFFTDVAGNAGTSARSPAYLLDTQAPAAPDLHGPSTTANTTSASYTFTAEAGSVAACRQLFTAAGSAAPLQPIGAGGFVPCVSPWDVPLTQGDGRYRAEAHVTDAAGNVSADAQSEVYTLDTTGPLAPTFTAQPTGTAKGKAVRWDWTGETPTTGSCTLRLTPVGSTTSVVVDGPVACSAGTYAQTLTFGDGFYQLSVQLTDPQTNAGAVAVSTGYTLDATPPAAPTVSGPTGTSNVTSVDYAITSAVEPLATEECRLTRDGALVDDWAPCALPRTSVLGVDGSYVLAVRLTDRYGNLGAAGASPAYLLDTKAPAAPDLHGPSTTANTTSASYTFTAESGSTAACRLLYAATGAPALIGAGGFVPCASPWDVPLTQGDGRYRAEAHVTDAAGNVSLDAQSEVYTLDTTGPLAPTFTAQPTGTARGKAVRWDWTGESPTTGICTLSFTPTGSSTTSVADGPVACDAGTYATTLTSGDGFYQLSVQLVDPSTNLGAVAVSTGYTLDATPPVAPTVSGPTGTGNRTAVDYSFAVPVEPLATAECRLTRDTTLVSDWSPCSLPRTITLGVDGSYVLDVRLTDQYGNLGPSGASPAYLLDTALPAVPVVTAPASPSANASPVFTIGTDPDTTTTCQLLRGSAVAVDSLPCAGSYTAALGGLPDGDYVLAVTATDPAGNTATGASRTYQFDTTKPVAPAVSGPAGPSQTRNPVFSWTGEPGARAECSLQEKSGAPEGWGTCATPYAPSLAADGSWVLSVRLTDAAGNVSDTGNSGAYVFDTTPPVVPAITSPPSPGRDLAPSWSAATEEGSSTECRLSGPGDLGTWAHCTLPLATQLTADGLYTFQVRATDVAGNVSPVGSGTYLLDTLAPAAPVVSQPTGPGRTRTPSIAFSSEAGTHAICRLTHGSTVLSDSAPCGSPTGLDLTGVSDGAYTLSVRVVDAAGNIGPAGTATYVLDTTAPTAPTYTLVAGSPSSDRVPTFAFNAELGTTPSCKLTMPSGAVKDLTCGSPLSLDLSNATDGDYVLAVRATDAAGNTGPAATTTYALDSGAPAAPKIVGPTTPGSSRNPTWKISSGGPTECRLTRGTTIVQDWAACGASYSADLYAQPDGAYILEARLIGTTAPTSSRYRLDTSGPAAASIVGPPSPSTDRKPTWAVSSVDTTARAECRLMVFTGVLKDWAPCPVSPAGSLYTLDLTGSGDGTYTLLVRLTDAAGNVGPTATSDYVLDTSAPSAVGVIAPLSPGNDTTPTWTLTSAPGVKLECRLSSGPKVISDFAPCAGTFTADLTGLPDGTYTLTVHALSSAGTPGPETTSGYILDTTAAGAPGTLTGPTGPSRDRAPKWTFTLAPGTTATCRVTIGGKVFRDGPCTSPFVLDLSTASDGTYTLTVRAVDAAGNLGSPSTAGYILKTSPPPPPTLTMQPGTPSSTTSPRWGFSLYRGTTGQCRLLANGAPTEDWTACRTPVAAPLAGKPDGSYTMQVRAIDVAQNTSSPVGSDYVLDRTAAPLAEFVTTPDTPGNDTTPTWVVAAPAAVAGSTPAAALVRAASLTGTPQTECRLTTARGVGGWAPCSGSYTATTNGDGTYLLEVRAFDSTGERGPVSSSSYQLDTHAPAAPRFIDPVPPAVGNDPEVAWSWAEDENLVQCHVLRAGAPGSGFSACDPPYVVNVGRQGEATYTIEARAVDAAGNVGPATSSSYRYDITPPAAPSFTSRPPARGASSSVSWTFAVPVDTSAVCVVTRNGTVMSEGACNGAFTLDLRSQQPATWALSVHLVDAAGNAGPSTVGTYTLTSAVGGGRVDNGGGGTSGSGPAAAPGAGAPVPATGAPKPPQSGANGATDQPRAGSTISHIPDAIKKGVRDAARLTAAIPGAIPGTDVPAAIKNVLGQTITKPQLPLALFVIVLLFLLVQNRIDRRDPKLAAAPVSAEPELTFGPILRPGGATP